MQREFLGHIFIYSSNRAVYAHIIIFSIALPTFNLSGSRHLYGCSGSLKMFYFRVDFPFKQMKQKQIGTDIVPSKVS